MPAAATGVAQTSSDIAMPTNGTHELDMDTTGHSSNRPISPYPPPIGAAPVSFQQQNGQPSQGQQPASIPFDQLRQEIPPAPPTRAPRKRKSPPDPSADKSQQQPPPPQPQIALPSHDLGPPGSYPHMPMAQYPYPPPSDYAAAGIPPPHMIPPHPGAMPQSSQMQQPGTPDGSSRPTRQLSTSKRAEQNRKAQRAFRERRDQHVKTLESRSQLLDAALASADEANRRWEECRALVDQLRIENAALRSALQQTQLQLSNKLVQEDSQPQQSASQSRQPSMGPDGQ